MLLLLGVEEEEIGSFFLWLDLHHDLGLGAEVIAYFCPFLFSGWGLWDKCFEVGTGNWYLFLLFFLFGWGALFFYFCPSLTSDKLNKAHRSTKLISIHLKHFLIFISDDSFLMKQSTRFFSIGGYKSKQNGKQAKDKEDSKGCSDSSIINSNHWFIDLWLQ